MASYGSGLPERVAASLNDSTMDLWFMALLGFGLGDLVTTMAGFSVESVAEVGPFVAPLVNQFGFSGLVGVKAFTFVLAGLGWWITPRPYDVGVPLGLAILGGIVTVWNGVLLVAFG